MNGFGPFLFSGQTSSKPHQLHTLALGAQAERSPVASHSLGLLTIDPHCRCAQHNRDGLNQEVSDNEGQKAVAHGIIQAKCVRGCGFKSPALGAGVEAEGVLGRKNYRCLLYKKCFN